MTLKGSKTVPIEGLTDKQMITATFMITLDGNFLPVQLINGGLASKSLRSVKFPFSFSVSANPKHCSHEKVAITVVNDIIMTKLKEND